MDHTLSVIGCLFLTAGSGRLKIVPSRSGVLSQVCEVCPVQPLLLLLRQLCQLRLCLPHGHTEVAQELRSYHMSHFEYPYLTYMYHFEANALFLLPVLRLGTTQQTYSRQSPQATPTSLGGGGVGWVFQRLHCVLADIELYSPLQPCFYSNVTGGL